MVYDCLDCKEKFKFFNMFVEKKFFTFGCNFVIAHFQTTDLLSLFLQNCIWLNSFFFVAYKYNFFHLMALSF